MTHRDATFSLYPTILATLGMQRSLEGNTARDSPCPKDLGGAPALTNIASQAMSPLHFCDAWEEPMLGEELSEQALQITQLQSEVESLKIDVGQLGLLINSFSLRA